MVMFRSIIVIIHNNNEVKFKMLFCSCFFSFYLLFSTKYYVDLKGKKRGGQKYCLMKIIKSFRKKECT